MPLRIESNGLVRGDRQRLGYRLGGIVNGRGAFWVCRPAAKDVRGSLPGYKIFTRNNLVNSAALIFYVDVFYCVGGSRFVIIEVKAVTVKSNRSGIDAGRIVYHCANISTYWLSSGDMDVARMEDR